MNDATVTAEGRVRLDEFGVVHEWSSLTDLAADYWRYQRLSDRAKKDADMSAWTCVHDLVTEPAWADALDLIDALLAATASDAEVGLVAAGPLEDLVAMWSEGPRFVGGIERRARSDARWASAVKGVWLDRAADPNVNRRLAIFGATHADGQKPT